MVDGDLLRHDLYRYCNLTLCYQLESQICGPISQKNEAGQTPKQEEVGNRESDGDGTALPRGGEPTGTCTDEASTRKRPAEEDCNADATPTSEGLDAMKSKLLASKSRRNKKKKS